VGRVVAILVDGESPVHFASFAPDGERILTRTADGACRVHDADGRLEIELKVPGHFANGAAFAPDGRSLWTATDSSIRRHDLGAPLSRTLRLGVGLATVALSPDGESVLATSTVGSVHRFDARGNHERLVPPQMSPRVLRLFCPDESVVLTAAEGGPASLVTGLNRVVLRGHESQVIAAGMSPDGSHVLTGARDGTAWIWTRKGARVATLAGHRAPVGVVAFSQDGTRVLTASDDGGVRIWSAAGKEVATLEGHAGRIVTALFFPDAERVLTASADGTAAVYGAGGSREATFGGHQHGLTGAALSPDGRLVATGDLAGQVTLWNPDGSERRRLDPGQSPIRDLAFLAGNRWLVVLEESGAVRCHHVTKPVMFGDARADAYRHVRVHPRKPAYYLFTKAGAVRQTFETEVDGKRTWSTALLREAGYEPVDAALSLDGRYLVSAGRHTTFRFRYDTEKNLLIGAGRGGRQVVSPAILRGAEETWFALGEGDRTVLWNESGKERRLDQVRRLLALSPDGALAVATLTDGRTVLGSLDKTIGTDLAGDAESASFSASGGFVYVALRDGAVGVFDLEGRERGSLIGHEHRVEMIAQAGQRVLTHSPLDGTARLWDDAGREVARIGDPGTATLETHHEREIVTAAALSPDGSLVLTGTADGVVQLHDRDGRVRFRTRPTGHRISALALSRDTRILATGDSVGEVRLWHTDGRDAGRLPAHAATVVSLLFSPDGREVLAASTDGVLLRSPMDVAALLHAAGERLPRDLSPDEVSRYAELLSGETKARVRQERLAAPR
jgi:WD40 repeat protein